MKNSDYKVGQKITVNDKMQKSYSYILAKEIGDLADDFNQLGFAPNFTPQEMLKIGVFEGKYLNDCQDEFPSEWFSNSKERRSDTPNPDLNHFGVKSRLSLKEWQERKWLVGDDPRGWFQWYCRYYLGRRTEYDKKQINRWKSYKRHLGQVKAHCDRSDRNCRPRQRQGLLQWAYDSLI